jgi:ribosomal protein S6--L-glutamate ligase
MYSVPLSRKLWCAHATNCAVCKYYHAQDLAYQKTVFTNYSKDVEKILAEVGGAPVIIKLLEGTQGLGVVLAENDKAAISVIEAFNGLKARVIVQEFIKEAKGADIRAFVIDGNVVGAMKRQAKEGEFRSNLHRGGTAEVVTLTRQEENHSHQSGQSAGTWSCWCGYVAK